MKHGCPNNSCLFYQKKDLLIKDGSYFRSSDSRHIQRFKCTACNKRFSSATFSLACFQKKRRINQPLYHLLCSGVSLRRCAQILKVKRVTVERRIDFLTKKAKLKQDRYLKKLHQKPVTHVQFDDLITIEHTKLKPVSVSLAVDVSSKRILSIKTSPIPAFGHLSKLSKRKYGYRKSEHRRALKELFDSITPCIKAQALFESDEHNLYPEFVREYFPQARHKRYKGGRGCIAGQGELKKLSYDPLFILNHTCAMLRANINRLIRRTWCTTKRIDRLQQHLEIYMSYHNFVLLSG